MLSLFHSLASKIRQIILHTDPWFCALASLLVIYWLTWYIQAFQPYFYGDELHALGHSIAGTWSEAFQFHSQYKPRWVSNAIISSLYREFSHSRNVLVFISIGFQVLGSIIFYGCIQKIGLSKGASVLIVLATSVSRFNLYCVYEVNLGMIEGSAWVFFIASLYFWVLFIQENKDIYGLASTIMLLISGLCHERYLPIVLLTVSFQLFKYFKHGIRNPSVPLILSVLCPLMVAVLFFQFMPKSTLSGTGGAPVSIMSSHTAHQIASGLSQVFGVNSGPSYLCGEARGLSRVFQNNAIAFYVLIGLAIAYYAGNRVKARGLNAPLQTSCTNILIFPGVSFFILLFIASISIRQEMRWLLQPFFVLIFIAIFFLVKYRIREVLLIVLSIGLLVSSMTLFQSQKYVYYASACKDAKGVGQLMQSGIFDPQSTTISDGEPWTFQDKDFMLLNFCKNSKYTSENKIPYLVNSNIGIRNGKVSIISIGQSENSICDEANKNTSEGDLERIFHLKQLLSQEDWSKTSSLDEASQWSLGAGCHLSVGKGIELPPLEKRGVMFQKITIKNSWTRLKCLYEAKSDFTEQDEPAQSLLAQINWLKIGVFLSADSSRIELSDVLKFHETDFAIPPEADSCLIYIAGPLQHTLLLKRVYVFPGP